MDEAVFYVGTYAAPEEDGIFLYRADFAKQEFQRLHAHKGTNNPSYLLQRGGVLYVVEEFSPEGELSAYRVDGADLKWACTLPSYGADPCHLEMDDNGQFLFVANYSSGSLAVFWLNDHGIPRELCSLMEHRGKGADPTRQEGPHVHFSRYHEGVLYVCDLGLDTVFRYRLDGARLVEAGPSIAAPQGYGPRHLCIHPRGWLFVLGELSAHVLVYHRQGDRYTLEQDIDSLPETKPAGNTAAAIKLTDDGQYLLVSNRGHDSITLFAVGEDGTLRLLDTCATGGRTPRDFALFGDNIVVANQDTGTLTAMRLNRDKEKLEALQMQEQAGRPVCILSAQTM